jgi:lysozyme
MSEQLKADLIAEEGRVPYAYPDSLGLLTIGVGHLIDHRKGGYLPDCIIDALLNWDIDEHTNALLAALPWAATLDDVRKDVLIQMHFQMGGSGLLAFHNTLSAIQNADWQAAHDGMLASTWATQSPARAKRLAQRMLTGVHENGT